MPSAVPEELGHDLAMMARVVQSQLISALTAFFQRDIRLAEKVMERDDQVDNFLGLIEEKCFAPASDATRSRHQRGILRVAVNLEKLGDYAVNVAEQAVFAARFPPRPHPFDLAGAARVALAGLDEVIQSFALASAAKAKRACRCEPELDRQYRDALAETFRRLARPGQDPAFVITHLFVSKFLERIGDSILNIGETTLFILTGERLKLHQYLHLEEMVGALGSAATDTPAVDVRQIWGGISGARVGRLSFGEGADLIWKEGAEAKIEEEIREIEEWNRVAPGLVPDLKGRLVRDGRESFVREYLHGVLLRDVYVTRPWADKARITARVLETMRDVWLATARREAPRVDYARQIEARLAELYAIHPRLQSLRGTDTRVFGIGHRSLSGLLARVAEIEPHIAPPVSVRIHGDFNTNNVIYDGRLDSVRFIDVHRSGAGDYLQDIGVFLVSNLRNPLEDATLIAELERVNRLVTDFAAEFARLVGDDHFQARLLLSQARSLITSARLVTDGDFARGLYLRGVRYLEKGVGAAA
jgi:phosphate uptake regulator/aminoglycoside phosphotransferase (APT) family kinase protein